MSGTSPLTYTTLPLATTTHVKTDSVVTTSARRWNATAAADSDWGEENPEDKTISKQQSSTAMPTTRSSHKRTLDASGIDVQLDHEAEDAAGDSKKAHFRAQVASFAYDIPTSPSLKHARLYMDPFPIKDPRSHSTTTRILSSYESPSRRRRPNSKYAAPSTYAHLPHLTDVITTDLIVLFVGTNPGLTTASSGHAYAHPSNLFWRLLHRAGLTDTQLAPSQDVHLPRLYAMGNTNLVSRPSRDAAQLSAAEMSAGTPALEDKVRRFRPESVCVVGKGIWEAIFRWREGRALRKGEFEYGWQEGRLGRGDGWEGAPVFVATSTSGLSAGMRPAEKEAIWRPFGNWVVQRREDRQRRGLTNPVWEGKERKIIGDDNPESHNVIMT